jgi:hypothetical protein
MRVLKNKIVTFQWLRKEETVEGEVVQLNNRLYNKWKKVVVAKIMVAVEEQLNNNWEKCNYTKNEGNI